MANCRGPGEHEGDDLVYHPGVGCQRRVKAGFSKEGSLAISRQIGVGKVWYEGNREEKETDLEEVEYGMLKKKKRKTEYFSTAGALSGKRCKMRGRKKDHARKGFICC